jgi:Mrp family chromosome partitioning ATPase
VLRNQGLPAIAAAVRRRWLVCLLIALPFALAVGGYAYTAPSQYDAETTVAFSPRPPSDPGADIIRVLLPSYVSLLQAPATVATVSERTGVEPALVEGADVSIATDTANLVIVVRDTDPERAAVTANALAGIALAAAEDDNLFTADQVARALPPDRPSAPPRTLLAIAGLFAGLIAGIALAVLAERGRPVVRTQEELIGDTSLRALGHLPKSRQLRGGPTLQTDDPLVASGMRAVLSRADHAASPGTVHALGITSPSGRHGRTTLTLAYAATAARRGRRVVVVDADLSRRGLTRALGEAPAEVPDVSALLSGKATLDECLTAGPVEGVEVLRAPTGHDAADLLAHRLPELVAALLRHGSDLVLVDCPPATDDDGQALLVHLPAVLLVVGAGTAHADVVEIAGLLEAVGTPVLGAVLNRSRRVGEPRPAMA